MFEQITNWITADLVGLAVQLFFSVTIIFMLRDRQKPPVATSVMTGLALIVLGVSGSFSAMVVSAASILNGCLWLGVGFQRYAQRKQGQDSSW